MAEKMDFIAGEVGLARQIRPAFGGQRRVVQPLPADIVHRPAAIVMMLQPALVRFTEIATAFRNASGTLVAAANR
ncbi:MULTISPECIES: hypothetical protein [unclassified Brenneria]|uniref:hypothetical protein n=1 Tax=unclassified Brenneria TaxID=2634434 RepID=UPI0029C57627|nr:MULTISPECIES: hypothetical protein [unclassified Brenneria]MDX5631027.1 hypothetical protein [Brenneria sp. L3-3Z]MDX5698108.1 hypothetical protein [Brenneria sp. L4-2C]